MEVVNVTNQISSEVQSVISRMDQEYFSKPWTNNAWQTIDESYYLSLLESAQGEVSGFCLFKYNTFVAEGHLLKILVAPSHRNLGLGKQLLLNAVKSLPKDTESIYLEVEETNDAAINFYKKLGFDLLRHVSSYYSDGTGALAMQVSLKKLVKPPLS